MRRLLILDALETLIQGSRFLGGDAGGIHAFFPCFEGGWCNQLAKRLIEDIV